MKNEEPNSFWITLPGIITGIATLLTAIGGLLLALHQIGVFDNENGVVNKPEESPEYETSDRLVVSNLEVQTGGGKPYEVIYNGLKPGSKAAVDRNYVYKEVPHFLDGETYIMPAHHDKWNKSDFFMSFTVNKSVKVYIAYDTRYKKKPNWLMSFEDTGYEWKTGIRGNHTY